MQCTDCRSGGPYRSLVRPLAPPENFSVKPQELQGYYAANTCTFRHSSPGAVWASHLKGLTSLSSHGRASVCQRMWLASLATPRRSFYHCVSHLVSTVSSAGSSSGISSTWLHLSLHRCYLRDFRLSAFVATSCAGYSLDTARPASPIHGGLGQQDWPRRHQRSLP